MHSTPKVLKAYDKAQLIRRQRIDEIAWHIIGNYGLSAITVAVEHCLHGKSAKSKYTSQPVMENVLENYGLTQEEIDERELQKMLLAEEQWQRQYKRKGLQEVVTM